MGATKQLDAALLLPLCLGIGMAAALAWYFDVFVNWQQKLYPLAIVAADIMIILLTLCALRAMGERRPLVLLWKTALSMAVFTAVLVGGRGALHVECRAQQGLSYAHGPASL